MKATTKDMRFSPKRLLDAASRGEEVIITYRGKPSVSGVEQAVFKVGYIEFADLPIVNN